MMMVNHRFYENLTPEKVDEILDGIAAWSNICLCGEWEYRMTYEFNQVCLTTLGMDKPWSMEAYRSTGGYRVWEKILAGKMTPAEVIDRVKASGLRGRGGAGSRRV